MATAKDFRRIALSLEGTTEAPHFDRTAFKVKRIYATLAGDEKTANLMFATDEQALKCELAPEAFSVIPNAWGARGATTVKLSKVSVAELRDALTIVWKHALPAKPSRGRTWRR
jgi:hypothetical protein